MPIVTTPIEDGRILYLTVTDPLTSDDIRSINNAGYIADVPFELHILIDIRALKAVNPGLLKPSTFVNVNHKNHGQMAIVGANPMVRIISNNIMSALGFRRVRFYASIDEAREWLETRVAADKDNEQKIT